MKPMWMRSTLPGCALVLAFVGCSAKPPERSLSTSTAAQQELTALRARFPKAALAKPEPISHARARVTLPETAAGEVELADTTSNVALRFRLQGAPPAERADADSLSLYVGAGMALRVSDAGVEDFVSFSTKPAREEVRYSVDVARVAGLRLIENSLELLDAQGSPRLRVAAPYLLEQGGALKPAQLTVDDCAYDSNPSAPWGRAVTPPGAAHCTVRVTWRDVSYPALLDPAWVSAGSGGARDTHTAVKLTNGQVLVVFGNFCGGGCLLGKGAFVFDPDTNMFAGTGSPGGVGIGAPGVGLKNGKALLNGSSTLLYDPVLGQFSDAAPIAGGLAFTLLDSGKVLLTGATAALYNPTTDTVEPTGAMASRAGAAAARLQSGKVLVVGGGGLTSAEIYDPETNAFSPSKGNMAAARQGHSALTLASGKVLILDGKDGSAELYDPEQDSFAPTGSMQQARLGFEAIVLESGKALVVGGFIGKSGTRSVERYEPESGKFETGPSLLTARGYHRVTLLDDGSALATFGRNQDDVNFGSSIGSVERLSAAAPGASCTDDDACRSGICDQGVCCASACTSPCHACAADSGACEVVASADDPDTCSGASTCDADGACKKKLGQSCKAAKECVSAFCTDGFCCDQACGGSCEACDALVPGTCSPIAGSPHGERACDGGAVAICAGACDGEHTDACAYPGVATGCGTSCDGEERVARTCDGQGECIEQASRPCPGNLICADAATCLTACATDDDCIDGYACDAPECKPTASCDGDHTIRAADGKTTTDCAPFKCDAQNRCKTQCESVGDCANPFVCDASGACIAAPPHTISAGCGLARHPASTSAPSLALALMAALVALRRRRRATQNA
jgi:hypothetical protein